MAGTKDNVVVAVIEDSTNEQAAQMTKEIMNAKIKCTLMVEVLLHVVKRVMLEVCSKQENVNG